MHVEGQGKGVLGAGEVVGEGEVVVHKLGQGQATENIFYFNF